MSATAIDNEYIGITLDTVNNLGLGEGVEEVTEHAHALHEMFPCEGFQGYA